MTSQSDATDVVVLFYFLPPVWILIRKSLKTKAKMKKKEEEENERERERETSWLLCSTRDFNQGGIDSRHPSAVDVASVDGAGAPPFASGRQNNKKTGKKKKKKMMMKRQRTRKGQ